MTESSPVQPKPETANAIAWHARSASDSVQALNSNAEAGLSADEAAKRLREIGPNKLAEAAPDPMWKKFAAQFKELVIWILIAAAIISGVMGEWIDTVAILAIVLLNAILGFVQEEKAGRALAALQKLSSPEAKVFRAGALMHVPAAEIIPGDILDLEAGDYISADARLINAYGLNAQEAALTGESVPTEKDADAVLAADASLGDRVNLIFMGTTLTAGKARAIVVETGMRTELGRIAGLIQQYVPEPTPLQKRLAELGRLLVFVCLGIVAIIFALELWQAVARGTPLLQAVSEVFLVAVSLAVAAVPEGLPAVVTVALALGLQRMVKRNALIRKLPSVETLGSVTVICSDKTGTLTRNEMTVQKMLTASGTVDLSGLGYEPKGEFASDGISFDAAKDPLVAAALRAGLYCNNSELIQKDGQWSIIGDPTEGALVVAAEKAGLKRTAAETKLLEIPFDSDRKMMSVIIRDTSGAIIMYSKGAPEVILGRCSQVMQADGPVPLDDAGRARILESGAGLAGQALRVLALAQAPQSGEHEKYSENELTFLALVGMKDPAREEAGTAVQKCHQAGIRPVMITGDHPLTAAAIARELHISKEGETAITGRDLDSWSDDDLAGRVDTISVYARVTAEHKLRIVKALRARGQIVAMTGDGVNDAPAIKTADIGIAMGITGTDVTKEAADMVLTDDNFASIVNAVEEGRSIFDNIQKFVQYLLSCNTGEVLLMFVAALLGWPMPLIAIHLLWINLVTDGLPALALGMEPPEKDIMNRPPRPPHESVITRERGLNLLINGVLLAAAGLAGFGIVYEGNPDNLAAARTTAFFVTALAQLAYSFACRSFRTVMPKLGFFTNPALIGAVIISGLLQLSIVVIPPAERIFQLDFDHDHEWTLIIVLALAPVTVIELAKFTMSYFKRSNAPLTHP